MDPDEVARLVAELKLSAAGKKSVVRVPTMNERPDLRRLTNVVVGRIFDTRVVNRDTLRSHLPRIMQLRRETEIEIVGDNIFAVRFGSEDERSRALYDGPWHFFRSLLIFKEPVGTQHPSEIKFEDFTTWIQIHNLPLICMAPATVRRVGETIGRVLEVDINEGGSCIGQFARVRVTRPIEEPLERCVTIEMEGAEEERMALIRYEKLSNFCMACGRVGHVVRHCRDMTVDKEVCAYGPWLRAGSVMESRRPHYASTSQNQGHGRGIVSGGSGGSSSMVKAGESGEDERQEENSAGETKVAEDEGDRGRSLTVVNQPQMGPRAQMHVNRERNIMNIQDMQEGFEVEGEDGLKDIREEAPLNLTGGQLEIFDSNAGRIGQVGEGAIFQEEVMEVG